MATELSHFLYSLPAQSYFFPERYVLALITFVRPALPGISIFIFILHVVLGNQPVQDQWDMQNFHITLFVESYLLFPFLEKLTALRILIQVRMQ